MLKPLLFIIDLLQQYLYQNIKTDLFESPINENKINKNHRDHYCPGIYLSIAALSPTTPPTELHTKMLGSLTTLSVSSKSVKKRK
jgi:hypothetical protein